MKILTVCTGFLTHTQWIRDADKADSAYAALKKAMEEYKPFKNDREDIVTVDCGNAFASFKTETIVMVSMDDLNVDAEDTVVERVMWDARIKAKIAARTAASPTHDAPPEAAAAVESALNEVQA